MIAIKSIIDTLNSEEQQKFITYLYQKNKRKDTKNILLFKLLANSESDSKTICRQLYKTEKSNAYHALENAYFNL